MPSVHENRAGSENESAKRQQALPGHVRHCTTLPGVLMVRENADGRRATSAATVAKDLRNSQYDAGEIDMD